MYRYEELKTEKLKNCRNQRIVEIKELQDQKTS